MTNLKIKAMPGTPMTPDEINGVYGKPDVVTAIYDNEGLTLDRYTVVTDIPDHSGYLICWHSVAVPQAP